MYVWLMKRTIALHLFPYDITRVSRRDQPRRAESSHDPAGAGLWSSALMTVARVCVPHPRSCGCPGRERLSDSASVPARSGPVPVPPGHARSWAHTSS